MASTVTTYAGFLKRRYVDPSTVAKLMYPNNPLLEALQKVGDTGMSGESIHVPIEYGLPQNFGRVFSTAQALTTNVRTDKWLVEMGEYYGVVGIGDRALMASRNNAGAFFENKTREIDGVWEQAAEIISLWLWGNGGGAIGRVAAIAGNVVTLTLPSQASNFEIGMVCQASTGDGSSATDQTIAGSDAVTAINHPLGQITFDNVADFTGTLAVGQYLFRSSDFFGDTGNIVIRGIKSFVYENDAPPALWGIAAATRALNPLRFAGFRVPVAEISGLGPDDVIRKMFTLHNSRSKAKPPDSVWVHPEDFETIESTMMAKGQRDLVKMDTAFGYPSITINTAGGAVKIKSDRHLKKGDVFGLRLDDWKLHSMGELFHPQEADGLTILRGASSTDYEYRLISYPGVSCRCPANQARAQLPAT